MSKRLGNASLNLISEESMLRIGGHVILTKKDYDDMMELLARCNNACPLLVRLKELEPSSGKPSIDSANKDT